MKSRLVVSGAWVGIATLQKHGSSVSPFSAVRKRSSIREFAVICTTNVRFEHSLSWFSDGFR
jgi:hypothetical protein